MGNCKYCMKEIKDGARFCPFCGRDQTKQPLAHHLPPGTVVGRKYRIGAVLGEGGFGITYAGFDEALLLRVAIKEFFPFGFVNRISAATSEVSCSADEEKSGFFQKGRTRFMQEARVLARFSGARGIVDVRDFFEENNTAYIVMEFVDGVTLKQYLKNRGKLSSEETLRLLTPVMESLELLHRENVIHRDISPDNIMIADGIVKLLDFGAARDVTGDRKTLSVLLKPGYAPYEQYQTHGKQGPWTDVYALCATMYRCVTGERLPDATDRLLDDSAKLPSALGADVTPGFEQALMKGLAVRPADRWQSMDALLKELTRQPDKPKTPDPAAVEKQRREAMEKEIAERVEREVAARMEKEVAERVAKELAQRAAAGKQTPPPEQTPPVPKEKTPPEPEATGEVLTKPLAPPDKAIALVGKQQGDLITFGSYPQSLVTDFTLKRQLNALPKNWVSYRYYSGTGNTTDGKMQPGDFMRYCDLTYLGKQYRAVLFDSYRPVRTGMKTLHSTLFGGSLQSNSGYTLGEVYYFCFEPVKWRVLSTKKRTVLSERILDSQPFHSTVYRSFNTWQDKNKSVFANDYPKSSIHAWLNETFLNTAFTADEQLQIAMTELLDDRAEASFSETYHNAVTRDRIFLLSKAEARNPVFGFGGDDHEAAEGRIAFGTDYAKCQGLYISRIKNASFWWLRSPASLSCNAAHVSSDGYLGYDSFVNSTDSGVRPAFCFKPGIL